MRRASLGSDHAGLRLLQRVRSSHLDASWTTSWPLDVSSRVGRPVSASAPRGQKNGTLIADSFGLPSMVPLQLVDSFLLNYNVGQALLLVFVLGALSIVPLKSQKLLSLHVIGFGVVFLLTPQALVPTHYLFLGIVLVVVGPLLYVTANA
jgi:hypothetical protein